mgnify:CR=1 FL=1
MSDRNPRDLELIFGSFNLGFISLSVQVVLARLAVGFSGGNEIYLSIFFFLWLLFTGAGAFLIRKIRPRLLFSLLAIFVPISAIQFFLTDKIFGLPPGQLPAPHLYLIGVIISLFPVCFISGGLFSSVAFHGRGAGRSSRAYWGEAIGALAAGMLSTIYYLAGGRDIALAICLAMVCLAVAIPPKYIKAPLIILAMVFLASGFDAGIENALLRIHYNPFKFKDSVSSRLIRYDATVSAELTTLYAGGVKLADFPDDIIGQEIFYWPYLMKPEMKDIAFVGAEFHMVDQFVPKSIKRIYIFPENRWYRLLDDGQYPPEMNIWLKDPISFFSGNKRKLDVISITAGRLLSFYDYRLETRRFLDLCRNNLAAGGILSISIPAYDGMWHPELRRRIVTLHRNLRSLFSGIQIIPGDRLTFVCFDEPWSKPSLSALLERCDSLQLQSPYFNKPLIMTRLNDFKMNQTLKQIEAEERRSHLLAIGHGLAYYLSQFGSWYGLRGFVNLYTVITLLIVGIAVTLISGNFADRRFLPLINIFYFGFCAFLIEIIALFFIQILGGYMYLALGMIMGLFMAGMVFGAFWGTYITFKHPLLKMILGSSMIPYIIFTILGLLSLLQPRCEWFWLLLVGLAGLAGGLGYTTNAKTFDNRPGLPYGIDLAGAMVGTTVSVGLLVATIPYESVFLAVSLSGLALFATNWRTRG